MRYEWFIAKRYLRPQGGATFIFHLTLFSIGAVALGVAALITVLSVMNGFANDVRSKIIGARSHIIVKMNYGEEYQPALIQEYNDLPNVAAVSPLIEFVGMLYAAENPQNQIPTQVFGIVPEYEIEVSRLDEKIVIGDLGSVARETEEKPSGMVDITALSQTDTPGIIIGKEMARALFRDYRNVLGRRVTIMTLPSDDFSIAYTKPSVQNFHVTGVFESGYYEYDLTWAYVALEDAQAITGMNGKVKGLQLRLEDAEEAATVNAQTLVNEKSKELGVFGYPITWMEMNKNFFEALKIEKTAMDLILKIIILVATFNIIATIFMIVMAKTRDIGLLRAIGSSRRSVMMIFLLVGIYIGLIGTALGIVGGYGVCSIIQVYPIELPGGGQVYNLKYLPCDMLFNDFAGVAAYTFVISFMAAIYPAVRASRLQPVDALRYN